jgi:transcriptional regulator with XRE-family HTH domain
MRNKQRKRTQSKTSHELHVQPVLPLRVARLCAQLSQTELAELAGVDKAYISRLESGERDIVDAGLEIASRIAWALHVTVADLWPLVLFADGKRIEPDAVRDAVGGRS